MGDQIKKN